MAERPIALPPVSKERAVMSIRQYVNGERFDAETLRIMGLAFEIARAARHIQDRPDGVDKLIAEQIIELAKAGEHDPDRLSEYALAKVSEADGRASQLFQASSASAAQAGSSTNPVSLRSRRGRFSS
jgi:hypothetical protein